MDREHFPPAALDLNFGLGLPAVSESVRSLVKLGEAMDQLSATASALESLNSTASLSRNVAQFAELDAVIRSLDRATSIKNAFTDATRFAEQIASVAAAAWTRSQTSPGHR